PALRWDDLAAELTPGGYYGWKVRVTRNGKQLWLPLPGPAAEALAVPAGARGESITPLRGPVFPTANGSGRALSYRTARDILRAACKRAGLRPVGSVELRSACAH